MQRTPFAQADAVVGRSSELATVAAFLDGRGAEEVLAIEGEAGIGKTVLWERGVREARHSGATVLVARGASAETGFAFAALGDLFDDLPTPTVERLPSPQRAALDRALLRAPVIGSGVDEHALCAATRSILRALADERPVVVAVDDAQWLDRSSSRVLAYALRRLDTPTIRWLITTRRPEEGAASFDRVAGATRRRVIEIGPLPLADLHALVEQRLGVAVPLPVLTRIDHLCAGNPLFALEVADAWRRLPNGAGHRDLPVPAGVRALLEVRVDRLRPEVRTALVDVALVARPTTALVDLPCWPRPKTSAWSPSTATVSASRIR